MPHIDSTDMIKGNESPFEFLQKNMERMEAKKAAFAAEGKIPTELPAVLQPDFRAEQAPKAEEALTGESPKIETAPQESDSRVDIIPPKDIQLDLPVEEEPVKEELSDNPLNEVLESKVVEAKKKDKDTNMKALRTKAEELERKYTETESRLNKILAGEEEIPTVAELKAKNKELEKYEKLHSLKISDEYHQAYVEPLAQLKSELVGLAEDYKVDPKVFNQALKINNKAELDKYLGKFFTPAGALDARQKIEELRYIDAEAAKADREPEEALHRLRQEHEYQKQQRAITRVQSIANTAKTAWSKAVSAVRQEEGFTVFNKTGDPENDKISDELLNKAAEDLGRFTTFLASKGLEELPEEQAEWLYKNALMGYGAPMLAKSLEAHYSRAENIISNNKRQQPLLRPGIGSSNVVSRGDDKGQKGLVSNQNAAHIALQRAGIKI